MKLIWSQVSNDDIYQLYKKKEHLVSVTNPRIPINQNRFMPCQKIADRLNNVFSSKIKLSHTKLHNTMKNPWKTWFMEGTCLLQACTIKPQNRPVHFY